MVQKRHNLGKPSHSIPKPLILTTHDEVSTPLAMSRRDMLKYSAAWISMAYGLAACDRVPPRNIVSRPELPEYRKPGKALYYSSTWSEGTQSYGVIVKTVDGRPIKIDGNPDCPINGGTSNAAMQGSSLSLYDPNRLTAPLKNGKAVSWEDVDKEVTQALKDAKKVVILTGSNLGPAERELIGSFTQACPNATHFAYEAIHSGARTNTWEKVFAQKGEWVPKFSQASIILSLESDFLETDGAGLENSREFALTRKSFDTNQNISRFYAVEAAMTSTGSNADHRIRLRSSAVGGLVKALRAGLKDAKALEAFAKEQHLKAEVLTALVGDLKNNKGKAVVVAGSHLPESVHASVALLNAELDAYGKTLAWNSAVNLAVDTDAIAKAFEGADVALFMGVNPVFSWSGDFSALMEKVKVTVGHNMYNNETLAKCTYALPSHHSLESWNDANPRDGLHSLCQPTISPLHKSRQEAETLLSWTQALGADKLAHKVSDWHSYVKAHWQKEVLGSTADTAWIEALRNGFVKKEVKAAVPQIKTDVAEKLAAAKSNAAGDYEIVLFPHHGVFDGRYANNPWLQELPDPVSRLVWDNAAAMSKATADKLGVKEGSMVSVTVGSKKMDLPVLVQPGMADNCIATTVGHGRSQISNGRTDIETIGEGVGFNTYALMDKANAVTPWLYTDVKVSKTGGEYKLVRTQKHFSMEGRPIVFDATTEELKKDALAVQHKKPHVPGYSQLHDEFKYNSNGNPYKWEMVIDLNACTGCNACIIACQAENNVNFVGKEECSVGREMHWIRIDRYEDGDGDDLVVHSQPMLCQHCDNAPCETVCPVAATEHSPDGINEMAYNRCVGTRYCANNCPYKVRRFNFYDYRDLRDSVQELAHNPQVTVRSRGVMEKCTFCIQRINAAKHEASNNGKTVADGAIVTACQQSCPSQAIHFGNANDPESNVSKLKGSDRGFTVFEQINVRPSVTYLAKVRNVHETLVKAKADDHGHHGHHDGHDHGHGHSHDEKHDHKEKVEKS